MGAEVWKIENPKGGDDTRLWGPPFATPKQKTISNASSPSTSSSSSSSSSSSASASSYPGESAYFLSANRNKRSIALNLKSSQGRAILLQLVQEADVVVENFFPGQLEKLGLGWEVLQRTNPSIILASITGWGADGPLAHQPGYDAMAAARGGLMHITGTPDEPVKVGVAVTDLCTGLYLHGSILAALYARDRDPQRRGQHVSASLLEVQVAALANIGQSYHVDPTRVGERRGTAHESIVPYQAFRCRADGNEVENVATDAEHSTSKPPSSASAATTDPTSSPSSFAPSPSNTAFFVCGALNQKQWHSFVGVMERLCTQLQMDASFLHSPLYTSNALRVRNRATLIPALQQAFDRVGMRRILDELDAASIPCAPIQHLGQVFSDPAVQHSAIIHHVDHPTLGQVTLTGPPQHFSRTPLKVQSAPPLLGQHTEQVLRQVCGAKKEQIDAWKKEGVIACMDLQK